MGGKKFYLNEKKIIIFSVGRSDYSIMRNIILSSQKNKKIKSYLCLSDAHSQNLFGNTYLDIKKDNIKNIIRIKRISSRNKSNNTSKIISFYITEADKILKKLNLKLFFYWAIDLKHLPLQLLLSISIFPYVTFVEVVLQKVRMIMNIAIAFQKCHIFILLKL